MTESDRAEVLRIAHLALGEKLREGMTVCGTPHRPSLLEPRAAFVSAYVAGELRGCIGRLAADQPLHQAVAELAIAAASEDPRFRAITVDELPETRLEVSLLSSPEPVHGPGEIEIGTHGVMVTRGVRRGLLLPKVAVEMGWSAEELLRQTCKKAWLDPEAWRDPETRVERFTAEVFAGDAPPLV